MSAVDCLEHPRSTNTCTFKTIHSRCPFGQENKENKNGCVLTRFIVIDRDAQTVHPVPDVMPRDETSRITLGLSTCYLEYSHVTA